MPVRLPRNNPPPRAVGRIKPASPNARTPLILRAPAATSPPTCARALGWLVLAIALAGTCTGCAWVRGLLANPNDEARRLTEHARDAIEAGRYEDAHELLERAGQLSPDDAEIHRLDARIQLAQDRRREAIEELRSAVELDRDDAASRVQLARLLVDEGLHDEALRPLKEALQIDARNVEALLLRAQLAEQSGDNELALEIYHRVLGYDCDQVTAKLKLARLQVTEGHWERAAPLLRTACECPRATPSQRAEAKWTLGIAYGRAKRWREAADELAAAGELKGSLSADDWYRLAYARLQADDFKGAWQAMEKTLQLNSRHDGALAMSSLFRTYGWDDSTSMPRPVVPAQYTAAGIPAPAGW